MSSPGQLDRLDVKRWLILAGTTVLVALIDFAARTVVPELEKMGGPTNALIALGLTLAIDFARRWLTNTNVVKPEDVPKIQVDVTKDPEIPGTKTSIIDWVKAKIS